MSYFRRLSNVSLKSSTRDSTCLDLTTTSSTYACRIRPSRNSIHHTIRPILLQHNALRAEKRRQSGCFMSLMNPASNSLASSSPIACLLGSEKRRSALALEALSEALAAEELTALRSTVNRDDVILDKRSKSTSFKPADEIVKFQVHPTDPTKTASIGAQLNHDVDAALQEFLL